MKYRKLQLEFTNGEGVVVPIPGDIFTDKQVLEGIGITAIRITEAKEMPSDYSFGTMEEATPKGRV